MSKSKLLCLSLIFSISVAGCGTQSNTSNGGASTKPGDNSSAALATAAPIASEKLKKLKEISIQAQDSGPSLVNLPIYIAIDQGFFEKRGFKVQMVTTKSSIAVQALMGGGLDYSSVFGTVVNAAANNKADVKGLMVFNKKPTMALMARPEIKTGKDLEGKVIAVPDVTSAVPRMIKLYLQKEKVDVSKVSFVSIPEPAASMAAAERNQVQAYYASVPNYFIGETKNMHELTDLGNSAPIPITGLATTMKKINENPQEVQQVVDALKEALVFINKNPEKMPGLIVKIMELSPADAQRTFKEAGDSYSVDGVAPKESMELLTDVFNDFQKYPPETYGRIVDWSYVQKSAVK